MNQQEYDFAIRAAVRIKEYGFILINHGGRYAVGVDTENDNWCKYGFIKENKLSPPFATIEECLAWMDGVLSHKQYIELTSIKTNN